MSRRIKPVRTFALLAFAVIAMGHASGCANAPDTGASVSAADGSVFDVAASDGRAAGRMLRATARAALWADDPYDFFFVLTFGCAIALLVLVIPVPT